MRHEIPILFYFYFGLGVVLSLPLVAIRMKFDDLGLSVEEMSYYRSIVLSPWSFKTLFGLMSDQNPIFGSHRKAYILLANVLAAGAWYASLLTDDLHTVLFLLVFAQACTTMFDVAIDGILVHYVKSIEEKDNFGKLQGQIWSVRALGSICGSLLSMWWLYISIDSVFMVVALFHMLIFFGCYFDYTEIPPWKPLKTYQKNFPYNNAFVETQKSITDPQQEEEKLHLSSMDTMYLMYGSLNKAYIIKFITFILLLNSLPSYSETYFFYIVDERHISPSTISVLNVVIYTGIIAGNFIYQRYFVEANIRAFFVSIIIASTFLSLVPLLMVYHYTDQYGWADIILLVSDGIVAAVFSELSVIPMLVLCARVAPKELEATVYAFLVSILNFSTVIANFLGGAMAHYFEINHHHYTNFGPFIILASVAHLTILLFLPCLPKGSIQTFIKLQEAKD